MPRAYTALIATLISANSVFAQDTIHVAPSPAEVTAQTTQMAELQRLNQTVEAQQLQIRQLQQRSVASQQAVAAHEDSLRAAVREMRMTTLSSWAHSTSSLQTGLQSAKAVAEIGNITLIYRPNDSPLWQSLMNYTGGAAGIVGMGLAAGSSGDDQKRAVALAASGFALKYVADIAHGIVSRGSQNNQRLRTYVERVSMHRNFAAEVEAMNTSIDSVLGLLHGLGGRADNLIDTGDYASTPVDASLVRDYRVLIESYSALVSQLQNTNSLATRLLAPSDSTWTKEISTNLHNVQDRTHDAIVRWRRQVIVSEGILSNLETLARIDRECQLGAVSAGCRR